MMYMPLAELLGLFFRGYTIANYVPMQNVNFTTTW